MILLIGIGNNDTFKEKNMPNIKSQKKRVLINREENARNVAIRTKVKNAIKKFEKAVADGNLDEAKELLNVAYSVIDSAKSDGIYHANNAANKKARLAKILDKAVAAKAE